MDDKTFLTAVAICALAMLEIYALVIGVNGQIYTLVIAVIAGLAGYEAKEHFLEKLKK